MFGLTKNHRASVYKTGKILAVLEAPTLLASRKHQSMIEHLQSLSGMPEEHFKISYHILVRRFAEYVQVLPTSLDHKLCSLLNESLSRATGVLQYYVQQNEDAEPLKRFALFSALLLRSVSIVLTKYNVIMTDEKGKHIRYWDPMQGPMTQYDEEKAFYKLLPLPLNHTRLEGALSAIIAPELMSAATYEWLTADRVIFIDWLDLVLSTPTKGGELTYFYSFFLEEELANGFNFDELDGLDVDFLDAPDSELADKFLEWLNAAIDNNELDFTSREASCHRMNGGMFIQTRVVDRFANLYQFRNMLIRYNLGGLFGDKRMIDFRFDHIARRNSTGLAGLMANDKSRSNGVYISDRFVKRGSASLSKVKLAKEKQAATLPSVDKSVRQEYTASVKPSNAPPK